MPRASSTTVRGSTANPEPAEAAAAWASGRSRPTVAAVMCVPLPEYLLWLRRSSLLRQNEVVKVERAGQDRFLRRRLDRSRCGDHRIRCGCCVVCLSHRQRHPHERPKPKVLKDVLETINVLVAVAASVVVLVGSFSRDSTLEQAQQDAAAGFTAAKKPLLAQHEPLPRGGLLLTIV